MPRKNNTGVAGALRLAQTQPVTFSEGLIRTDDNSVLGYVSDLYNTEIDRNGNIRRRKGSVVMNSGKLNEKWYFKESYQIAGVTVLFGLSYKRELWAWIGAWPETDFKVCEKNIYSRFPHYSSGSNRPDYNPWVSFSRGSSFHVLKTDRHMTIVNNLNDAVRIYNRGCFAIAKYNEDVTKTFMKEDIDASRNETDIDLALYVSVKDVTNRIMEPAIVVKSDDRYPLVEGTVEFAAMNEENVPGKFTDPQKIETGSPYFSIFDSLAFDTNKAYSTAVTKVLKASNGNSQSVSGRYAKRMTSGGFAVASGTWVPDNYPDPASYEKVTISVAIVTRRFYNYTNSPFSGETEYESQEETYLIMPGVDGSSISAPYIENDSFGRMFKVYGIRTVYPQKNDFAYYLRPRSIKDQFVYITGKQNTSWAIDAEDVGEHSLNLLTKELNIAVSANLAGRSATWYRLSRAIDYDSYGFKTEYDFSDSSSFLWSNSSSVLYVGRIDLYRKKTNTLEHIVDECVFQHSGFFYDKPEFMTFKHELFNTWSVAENPGFFVDVDDAGTTVKYTIANIDSTDGILVVDNTEGKCGDFLLNGNRWCVKSGDNIIARSQVGVLDRSGDNILYQLDALASLEENHNELPFQLKPAYLPVISLHGSSILRYPDPDKNTDVFYDVQYAFNVDDVLIVIQDGAIWTGNTNTLKLTYDKAIQGAVLSADRFYNGVLIGTTDGIYFYNNGKLEHCVDGQKITAITIASGTNGAVIVDDTGRLYYAYIMLMESGFYAKVNDIHRDVSDIDFSNAIVKYVNGVFYFAMEDQVIGLYIERSEEGTIRRFDRIYNFEGQKIDGITEYEGQPVLWFGTGAVKSEVFEQPYDGGDN